MLSSLATTLTAFKDKATQAAAKAFLNRKIDRFGTVTGLQINSKQKTMFAEFALKGETAPIVVNVGAYEVVKRGRGTFIVVRRVHASREWIGSLLSESIVDREFKVPTAVRMAL